MHIHRLVKPGITDSVICGMKSLYSVICSVHLNLLLHIVNYEQPGHFSGKDGTPYPTVIWLGLLDFRDLSRI
jgi:hypothetical protein